MLVGPFGRIAISCGVSRGIGFVPCDQVGIQGKNRVVDIPRQKEGGVIRVSAACTTQILKKSLGMATVVRIYENSSIASYQSIVSSVYKCDGRRESAVKGIAKFSKSGQHSMSQAGPPSDVVRTRKGVNVVTRRCGAQRHGQLLISTALPQYASCSD